MRLWSFLVLCCLLIATPAQGRSGGDSVFAAIHGEIAQVLAASMFRSLAYQPFSLPSGSMSPTLLAGDYVFVSKSAYGYGRYSFPFTPTLFQRRVYAKLPARGDIVVFKKPGSTCPDGVADAIASVFQEIVAPMGAARGTAADCFDYVKRVVGLPGDTVEMKEGILHLNGIAVPQTRTANFRDTPRRGGFRQPSCLNAPVPSGGTCEIEQWIEELPGGKRYPVLNLQATRVDTFGPVTVAPGHLFVLGDHRDNSVDSRFRDIGQVPIDNLIGRVTLVAFSARGALWNISDWRADRLLKSID